MKNLQVSKKIIASLICSLSLSAAGICYAVDEAPTKKESIETSKETIKEVEITSTDTINKADVKIEEQINPTKEDLSPITKATDSKKQESLGTQTHDLLRSMASLILLMLLLFVGSWFLKKKFSLKPNGKNIIGLVSVMNMGNKEKIALLKVGSQNILVGITQQNIRTLYTYPAEDDSISSTKVNQQSSAEASKEFSFIMDRATSKDEPEKKGKDNG